MQRKQFIRMLATGLGLVSLSGLLISPVGPYAYAQSYQEQINQLNAESAEHRALRTQLEGQAATLEDKIAALNAEINGLEKQIGQNQAERAKLKRKIAQTEKKIAKQKAILKQNIRAIYVEGNTSTIVMLASSQDLGDYLDKEQYRLVIQEKINDMIDEINALQAQLEKQRVRVDKLIADQKSMQKRLAAQKTEQARLLALNQSQRRSYNREIAANNAEVAELQRQQAAENARLAASSGGSYTAGNGVNCGGGYPGDAPGPWGRWGCNYPIDNAVDTWGMYNRQCVSYTAFKVANSGRHMPYWGGRGNARNWDDNARAAGIPVDYSPRAGDVAVSNSGYYGHVMYVEHVGGNGDIYVSDYNQQWDGRYREYWISGDTARARGLVYIHF